MMPRDFNDIVKAVLSLMLVGTFVCVMLMRPESYKDPIIQALSVVLGYWLGSSSGSKEKTEMLKEKANVP